MNCSVHLGKHSSVRSFVELLKSCANRKDVYHGSRVHADILRNGLLDKSPHVASTLISMYAKCGMLPKAQQVLDELPVRDAISWSALIAGYAQHGKGLQALECFERMQTEGLAPDAITYISILKACGSIGDVEKGKQFHDDIANKGYLYKSISLGNALVDMYVKCGLLRKAYEVLEELPFQDVISWSTVIAGYAENGEGHNALKCYERMQNEGISPNEVTFTSVLKACTNIGDICKGRQIHEEITGRELLEGNVVLGTALVDMYAKCKHFKEAWQVLEEMQIRSIVSWNALIGGLAGEGQGDEALQCYEDMQSDQLSPDPATFVSMCKVLGRTKSYDSGKRIHHDVVARGFLGQNTVLGNALVDMYAKCGALVEAQQVLDELPVRDIMSWSALITGYAQNEQGHEALGCLEGMQRDNISPDAFTFSGILKACGIIGAIDKGKQIHDEIISRGMLKNNVVLGTAIVDMYAKCGALTKAQEVMNELSVQCTASWSALIAGYAQQGKWHEALRCFDQMQREGHSPDAVTILCVLVACSHAGLVDQAQTYFGNMNKNYGITPNLEHHTCMVDTLGCAGHFEKALSTIEAMPQSNYPSVWLAMLNACKKWGNVEMGRFAFDKAVQLDNGNAVYYVLIADIYAAAGMQEDAEKMKAMSKRMKGK